MSVKVPAELAALAQPEDYKPALYRKIDWDSFASPAWRWERVLELVDRPGPVGRVTRRDDEWIRLGKTFLTQWRSGSDEDRAALEAKIPGMVHAYKHFDSLDSDPNKKFCIEARILADDPQDKIAYEEKTLQCAVNVYEKMFFDARTYLDRLDWVLTSILLPATDRFAQVAEDEDDDNMFKTPVVVKAHFDSTLKFLAYFGGPVMVEFALPGFRRGIVPRKQDDILDWIGESFQHQAGTRALQAMQEFEINKYNVMDLFMVHNQITTILKSQESQENKQTAIEKAVNAMMTEIPWTVGKHAKEVYSGTELGRYDEMAAELRDEEMMLLTSGDSGSIEDVLRDEVPGLTMPKLRPSKDKEVQHAGADSDAK